MLSSCSVFASEIEVNPSVLDPYDIEAPPSANDFGPENFDTDEPKAKPSWPTDLTKEAMEPLST